jgi:hypothetical protein
MEHDLAEVEHDWNIIMELRHDLGHDMGHDFWDMIFGTQSMSPSAQEIWSSEIKALYSPGVAQ